ncbi:MAG: hypothetical protein HY423_02895 [Candidatus Lambdaproteobacteria bacterium]|nr:hypothetical protein [Candidatus Lambdaproteobacteria bacterium]
MCTDAFVGLAKEESKNLGMPTLPLVIIPHPLGGEAKDVVHERAHYALDQVIRALVQHPAQ